LLFFSSLSLVLGIEPSALCMFYQWATNSPGSLVFKQWSNYWFLSSMNGNLEVKTRAEDGIGCRISWWQGRANSNVSELVVYW
jgi:hypothetical protein